MKTTTAASKTASELYYAVYAPSEAVNSRPSLVFKNLKEAKECTKLYHKAGARFKAFASEQQARQFAEVGDEQLPATTTPGDSRKELPALHVTYPAPTPVELGLLRADIQHMRITDFRQKVVANPRLLINQELDLPTVLNVGCRYNAMHVAARYGNWPVCRLIIAFLENTVLLKALNPNRSPGMLENARLYLLDLYLNSPEKMLNATPLFLACKYGHISVVRLLVFQKQCIRECKAADGKTAMDVVCESVPVDHQQQQAKLKEEMRKWLDRHSYYVPLYREGNSTSMGTARLMAPCADVPPLYCDRASHASTDWFLSAFAGPMDADQAQLLYTMWSTRKPAAATATDVDQLLDMRCRDAQKGMEHVGRLLTKSAGFIWTEYWSFMDAYCDIASADGLSLFNRHLALQSFSCRRFKFVVDESELQSHHRLNNGGGGFRSHHPPPTEDDSVDVFFDASSSWDSDDDDDDDEEEDASDAQAESTSAALERFYMALEYQPSTFIYGAEPMKADYDVFQALNGSVSVKVLRRYANVLRWYHSISGFPKESMAAWPPFDSPRARAMLTNSPKKRDREPTARRLFS